MYNYTWHSERILEVELRYVDNVWHWFFFNQVFVYASEERWAEDNELVNLQGFDVFTDSLNWLHSGRAFNARTGKISVSIFIW